MRSETGVVVKRNLFALGCLGLCMLSCDDSKLTDWNNPTDPNGGNYHPPTAAVRMTDSLFKDPEQVVAVAAGASLNSKVVSYDWKADNDSTSYAARTDSAIRLNGIRDSSTHLLQVRATDANGLTGDWSAPVRIHVWNHPPVLAHVRDTTLSANKPLAVKLSATDPDGTVSKIFWGTSNGAWTDSTGTVTLSPMSEGAKKIYWSARDDLGKVSVDSFTATFTDLAPVLAHVRDTMLFVGQAFSVALSAQDSDGVVKEYLFDTTGNGWDSSTTAPTLRITSTSESLRKIRWGARDDLGKTTTDSFAVTFVMDRPLLTAISDTAVSASKALVVPLNAHPLGGSSSVITEYLWSTNGSTWDSSSTASVSLSISDTVGGAVTLQWKVRNNLGNVSKSDTFVATFLHAPTITSLSVDSNLTSWSSGTGSLIITWAGSLPNVPAGETITWTLWGGTSGLSRLYSGTSTTYTQSGIDSGVTYNYRLVGKNRFGDSAVATGSVRTNYFSPSGTFTDARDGQSYKYVTIGSQVWMAQNLNYQVDSSWCPDGAASYCATYGRLYQWSSAMALSSHYDSTTWVGNDVNHQGICPSGWHIPSDAEWSTLVQYVDSATSGTKLKSTSGWSRSGNGTNAYGFNALPADARDLDGALLLLGYNAYFWSSSESAALRACARDFYYFNAYVERINGYKSIGYSLRCVRN